MVPQATRFEGIWSRKISHSAMPRKRSSRRSRPEVTAAACTAGGLSGACIPGDRSGACIPGDLSALMGIAESRPGLDSLNPVWVGDRAQRAQIHSVMAGLDPAIHLFREDFFAMDPRVISASTRVFDALLPAGDVR